METGDKLSRSMYELALAIGGSLDREAVLQKALAGFVRSLACTSGAIYLALPEIVPGEPAVALPAAHAINSAVQLAGALLPAQLARGQWLAFSSTLPQAGAHDEYGLYYLLPIGRQGLLLLVGCVTALDEEIATRLLSLTARLDEALALCLQHEALAAAQHTTANAALSAVLQTVGEGILSLDAAGRISLVNAELEHIFGYSAAELLGQPIDLLLPELTPGAQPLSSASAEIGAQMSPSALVPWRDFLDQRRELVGRRKDGTDFPVEVCLNEIASGEQARYTGALRDITERKEYERLRDEFVSTVSHELRTPLASIMGWTETLLTEHPGPLNDNQRRFLKIVYSSSQRLNWLIEEILIVSRIQRGTLRIHVEAIQPAQLLAAVRESAAPAAERQGIRLHFEDVWPEGENVMGDPQLLEQAINHLIANAVKFSRQGGDVYVRSLPAQDGWRLEVQDHGLGIHAADLPKLFQRFVRGANAKAAHTQGAGLGLFVSKAIVEAHGGAIYLTSREEEGTTVWFDLPLRRPSGAKDVEYGD